MNSSLGAPAVLIVDEDVGFVWWLGEIFHELGCRVVPALSCGEAIALAETASLNADIVVINPALAGVQEMIQALGHIRSPKIVAIHQHTELGRRDPDADAVLERPVAGESVSRLHWLRTLRGLLVQVGTRAAS